MEFFRQTNIDFLKYKWWAIGLSWALIGLGLITIFVQKGLKYGIDFSGGTAIAVRFAERPDVDHLRKILDGAGLGEIGIQRYEEAEKNEVLIRVQQQAKEGRDVAGDVLRTLRAGLATPTDPSKIDLNTEGKSTLGARLAAADPDKVAGRSDVNPGDYYTQAAERIIARRSSLGLFRSPADVNSVEGVSAPVRAWIQGNGYTGPFVLLSAENVGPQVGADLQKKALAAVIWSSLGMLAYVAFRFRSVPFGVGAVVAIIHDTLITVGLLALL